MKKTILIPKTIQNAYERLKTDFTVTKRGKDPSEEMKRELILKNERLVMDFQSIVQEAYGEPVCSIVLERAWSIIDWSLNHTYTPDRLVTYLFDELYEGNVFSFVDIADRINMGIQNLEFIGVDIPRFRHNNKLIKPTQAYVKFGNRENKPRQLRLILKAYNQRGLSLSDETREIIPREGYKIAAKLEWIYEHRKSDSESES